MRILLVEDDPSVVSFVRRGLREEHYTVEVATDGEQALFLAQTRDYDVMILDLILPKRSGLDVLRALRKDKVTVPIIILTAKDQLNDKVEGLNAGADDYLTKPFGFNELLARIQSLIRRRGNMVPTVLRAGDLEVDVLRRRVTRRGKELSLTSREYALLEFFLRYSNRVVTRTMLAEQVWDHDFDPLTNVIDVHVARLRRKIDDPFTPKLLQTVRGSGYILQVPEKPREKPQPDPALTVAGAATE